MDSNTTPRKLLVQADQIVHFWKSNPQLKLKGVTQEELLRVAEGLRSAMEQLAEFQRQVWLKASERNRLAEQLNQLTIRFRAAVHGYFGPDSMEYELVGGTRASRRRKPGRKPGKRA
jgi:hypothetical protein